MTRADELVAAILGKPIGLSGELGLRSCSGEYGHLLHITRAHLRKDGRELFLKVRSLTEHSGQIALAFEGYDSPESLSDLVGSELILPRSEAAPLKASQFYASDLVGASLIFGDKALARVVSVISGGADDYLEAEMDGGRRALVPFRSEFVGRVDLDAGSIQLVHEWILE